jgi:hypothetical protein
VVIVAKVAVDIAPMDSIKKRTPKKKERLMDLQLLKYKIAIYSKYHRVDIRYP